MKKFVLLIALCCGCGDKGEEEMSVLCDAIYSTEFIVVNETDKEITTFNNYPYGPHGGTARIAPSESKVIQRLAQLGPCDSKQLQQDDRDAEAPFFAYGDRVNGIVGYSFTMTVDEQDIPVEIWKRKYWSFTSDYYDRTYTLTVTDELLGEILE